ncbi:MAG TPA: hypothetical protein DDY49_05445 [Paenibacillaceae bacterium]|nr:hypothetical protein [Paenibacillaceae bacterium]
MVRRKQFVLALFLLFIIMGFSGVALANGQGENPLGDIEDPIESIGQFFGWVTLGVSFIGAASLFFFRKALVKFNNASPEMKDMLKSGATIMRKWHVPVGLIAFGIAMVHGVIMFFHETVLEMNEWTGIATLGMMVIALILGIVLALKKKISTGLRRVHSVIFMLAGIVLFFHIVG